MTIKIEDYYPTYTDIEKEKLQEMSNLIERVAEKLSVVIKAERKWGQLSFSSTIGTPIRIARFDENHVAFFVHCQTTLVEQWREMFTDSLEFSKTRAVLLKNHEELPINELEICIQMALTYRKE